MHCKDIFLEYSSEHLQDHSYEYLPSDAGGKREKIKTFLVATNVVARQLPERQLTGTPTVCARYRSTGVINVRTLLKILTKLSRRYSQGTKDHEWYGR